MVVDIHCIYLSRDLPRSRNQRVFRLYGGKLLILCNNSAVFGGHRPCGNGDGFNLSHRFMWPHVQRVA